MEKMRITIQDDEVVINEAHGSPMEILAYLANINSTILNMLNEHAGLDKEIMFKSVCTAIRYELAKEGVRDVLLRKLRENL